jgi:hypothetical protein
MSLFSRISGVVNSFFQIGGPAGPGINDNAGALEAKNSSNSSFVTMSVGTPTLDAHAATKAYVDTIFKPIVVTLQFNGSSSLPSNSAVEQYYVVTTTGSNATIGQLLWDDGSNSGTVTVLPAKLGNEIVTGASFTGGTITLSTNSNYIWSGSAWINPAPNITGAIYCIDMAITTGASQSSATSIPANAIILRSDVNVEVAFSNGATIAVGQTGTTNLLQGTADSTPQTVDLYDALQRTNWGNSALPVLVTITGSPSVGSGHVTVSYTVPNS